MGMTLNNGFFSRKFYSLWSTSRYRQYSDSKKLQEYCYNVMLAIVKNVIFKDQIPGERSQDHWSSGFQGQSRVLLAGLMSPQAVPCRRVGSQDLW